MKGEIKRLANMVKGKGRERKMPGIIIMDGILILLGVLGACISSDLSCLVVALVCCVLFNLCVGLTNSPENVDNKFRRWLLGRNNQQEERGRQNEKH